MNNAQLSSGRYLAKRLQVLPLFLGLLLASVGAAHAQSAGAPADASPTRAEVKMERDEFLRTHEWDVFNDNWALRPEYEPSAGVKSRAQVRAERDEFLRNNRWDRNAQTWRRQGSQPRDTSQMSRDEVREETQQFIRTHRWNSETQGWVERRPGQR